MLGLKGKKEDEGISGSVNKSLDKLTKDHLSNLYNTKNFVIGKINFKCPLTNEQGSINSVWATKYLGLYYTPFD